LEKRHFNGGDTTAILGVLKATTVKELDDALTIIEKSLGLKFETRGADVGGPPDGASYTPQPDIRKAMGLK